jgi:hypothetical protein
MANAWNQIRTHGGMGYATMIADQGRMDWRIATETDYQFFIELVMERGFGQQLETAIGLAFLEIK